MMILRFRKVAVIAVSVALLLTGCSTTGGFVPSMPPTPEPIFASDDEALEAVVAHYQEYLAVSDAVYADGGANPERLKPYVSDERYQFELEGVENFASQGFYTVGHTTTQNWMLQSLHNLRDQAEVSFYICVDVALVSLFDKEGNQLPDSDVPFPYIVNYLVSSDANGKKFTMMDDEIWESPYAC